MPLPEVFKTDDVARHLGVAREMIDREAQRIGCYVKAGRHVLFTADDVEALLSAWRPAPQVTRLSSSASGVSEERPFTPETLGREWGVSAEHIRGLIRSGDLAHFRVGRLIRISAAEARRYQERDVQP